MTFLKKNLTLILTVSLLLIFASFMFFKLFGILPFDDMDESYYLSQGFGRRYDFSWSFLYAGFYSLYFFIFNDALFIYHIHTFLISFVLVPIAVFLISFVVSKTKIMSLMLSVLTLFSSFNIFIIPKIQLFNFFMLCFLFLALIRCRGILLYGLVLNLAIYSIYLRQDNLLLIPFFVLFFFINKHHLQPKNWVMLIFSLLFYYLTIRFIQTPFYSKRSLHAFFDWFSWEGAASIYGVSDTSLKSIQFDVFKNPQSVIDLFINNFPAIKIHFLNNIHRFIERLAKFKLEFISHTNLQIILFGIANGLAATYGLIKKKNQNYSRLFLIFYMFLSIKCLATILFLSSREKYFTELALLFPIMVFSVFNILPKKPKFYIFIKNQIVPGITIALIFVFVALFINYEPRQKSEFTFNQINQLKEDLLKVDFASASPVFSFSINPIYFGNKSRASNVFEFLEQRNLAKINFIDYLEEKKFKILILPSSIDNPDKYYDLGLKEAKITHSDFLASKPCTIFGKTLSAQIQIYVCP